MKIVLSKTMTETGLKKTKVISENPSANIAKIKQQKGKNILIFGSPSIVQLLLNENLIDEFYLSVNPILLGNGKPLFKGITKTKKLKLLDSKIFPKGLIVLHYVNEEYKK